jgi:hypothetical protein
MSFGIKYTSALYLPAGALNNSEMAKRSNEEASSSLVQGSFIKDHHSPLTNEGQSLGASGDGDDEGGHRGAAEVYAPALGQQHHAFAIRPDNMINLKKLKTLF